MKKFVLAALVAVFAAPCAQAQTGDQLTKPDSLAHSGVPAMPPGPPPVPHYIRADWILPTPEQMKAAYPQKAFAAGVEGRAVIDCAVKPDGWLTSCDVIGESDGKSNTLYGSATGYGFGEAAVAVYKQYVHTTPVSAPHCYCRTKFTVNWQLH
jgi:TonB family protein